MQQQRRGQGQAQAAQAVQLAALGRGVHQRGGRREAALQEGERERPRGGEVEGEEARVESHRSVVSPARKYIG